MSPTSRPAPSPNRPPRPTSSITRCRRASTSCASGPGSNTPAASIQSARSRSPKRRRPCSRSTSSAPSSPTASPFSNSAAAGAPLALYNAARFPNARITAISNSRTQKEFIDTEARKRGLTNLRILTCDINAFDIAPGQFDRVVSVEMFEHLKNYQRLFTNITRWLKPGGLLFVHIFTHSRLSYHFVARDASDWMSRHFFTGGQMPAHDLLPQFQDDLKLVTDWQVDGTHYQKTAEDWLKNMDTHREEIFPLFIDTYGRDQATKWWAYWRVFYLSCAELWGYHGGREWIVSHYLFRKPE